MDRRQNMCDAINYCLALSIMLLLISYYTHDDIFLLRFLWMLIDGDKFMNDK